MSTPNYPFLAPKSGSARPTPRYYSDESRAARGKFVGLNIIPLTCFVGLGALAQYQWTWVSKYLTKLGEKAAVDGSGARFGYGNNWYSACLLAAIPLALPLGLIFGPWLKPVLRHFGLLNNPYMKEVVREKVWADLSGGEEDEEGRKQSPEYAVLLIGARCNGPFGALNADFGKIGKAFAEMWKQLEADPDSGMLNVESYLGCDRLLSNSIVSMGYFTSVDKVHAFAHKEFHRRIWKEYFALPQQIQETIEIWHELFTIKAGGSEAIYVNSTVHGLGAICSQSEEADADVEEATKWGPVLKVAKGKATTSRGRMGKE